MYMMNDENMWSAFEPLDSDNSFDTLDYWEYNGRIVSGEKPHKAFMTMLPGDKPCIYDETSGDFLSLPDGEGGFITELAECEEVGRQDSAFVGYKYRATENGKWGYVSAKLGEILAPCYDGILTTEDGGVVAWAERYDNSSVWIGVKVVDISFSQTVEHSSGASDVWLENFRDESGSGTKVYGETVDGWDPSAKLCLKHDAKDGISVYFPNSEESGAVVLRREDDGSWSKQRVSHYSSVLELRIGDHYTYCKSFNAENALRLVRRAFTQKPDFEVVERDDRYDEFIIRREGWYALADLYLDGDEVQVTYHTPFAFTRIERLDEPFIHTYRIERFGKVGIFNVIGKEYDIPCEYEDVYPETDDHNGWFIVEKAGFTGKLDLNGRWVEHLHREEE